MFLKKIRFSNSNDAIMLLKYTLLGLLIVLTPITLFLTAFSWYASLEYYNYPDSNIQEMDIFFKNALIFGSVGLMSFLLYFLIFLAIEHALKRVAFKWKKFILLLAVVIATLIFLMFEILSAIFVGYFYTWQISLVLTFWPVIYILLFALLLIDYFDLHNQEKAMKLNKNQPIDKDEINVISELSETIS